jgi:glycosyltransferase involved in cell wall biosynthesis
MKIGFDGKRVIQNFTGLGNYSRYILQVLACNIPENKYTVYSAKQPDQTLISQFKTLCSISFKLQKSKSFSSIWRTLGIVKDLKRDNIDIYHGLTNEIPIGLDKAGIASVVTIHDLIFLRYPHYFNFIDRSIYKLKVMYACKNATRIIAISEQTKRDILSFCNVPEERIEIVYQNCNSLYSELASVQEKESVRSKYNLPEKYLLNVGTIEARKNLLLIAKALKAVPDHIQLIVIGKQTAYAKEVKQYLRNNKLAHRVRFLSKVPLSDLPAIYQQAEIFIYPSEFEGFGIPIIEALHSRVPVIAATGSCLEEAGGPGSCYVHPKDEIQLSYCINSILNSAEKKEEMINEGSLYVQKFSDKKIAEDLMKVYKKALAHA